MSYSPSEWMNEILEMKYHAWFAHIQLITLDAEKNVKTQTNKRDVSVKKCKGDSCYGDVWYVTYN